MFVRKGTKYELHGKASCVLSTMRFKVLKMKVYLMLFILAWRFTKYELIKQYVLGDEYALFFNGWTDWDAYRRLIFNVVTVIFLYSQGSSSNVMLGLNVLQNPLQGWLERCVEDWEEKGKCCFGNSSFALYARIPSTLMFILILGILVKFICPIL